MASSQGHSNAVNLLLDAGARPNHLDEDGASALFFAGSLQVVKALLERGALATITDKNGSSVLHAAGCRGSDAGVLCALYKGGADPTTLDVLGKTAADCARDFEHEEAARMLDLLVAKHVSLQA